MAFVHVASTLLLFISTPVFATIAVFTKLIAFVPMLVHWKRDERISAARGVQIPQDEGKLAEFTGG